jgi:hypothetical protein
VIVTNVCGVLTSCVLVLFADISGFTAWSSEREPTQVFTLLQAIFHKFDTLARKRDVFKVETIGDCYVAVTGLPDPQPDHAVRMTKFARACIHKFMAVVKRLETQLGPGTSDLRMRFGLHSGPVTGKYFSSNMASCSPAVSALPNTLWLQRVSFVVRNLDSSFLEILSILPQGWKVRDSVIGYRFQWRLPRC